MRHYDGSRRWDQIEASLRRAGYVQQFACATFDKQPAKLDYTGLEGGWEIRRKLKAYCATTGITDYQIVRNTSYHRDLHGPVYELWVRQPQI